MGIRILTVDDSKTIRLIVARAFKTFDCEIMEAANGVEGLAVASRERPDIIILDVTMPVMDGTEMLGRLKTNPDLKSIPVVMLTAEAGRENVLRIAKMGVRDYLVKPFKEEQIVERVSRIVELKQRGGASKARKRFDDPLTLLLVDDKTAIHEQIRAGLGDTNWTIECQTQAHVALEVIGEKPPDLVLISTSMPEGSGFWLFQKLRGSIKTERLPVYALSVKTAVEDQARAQQVGFNGIVTKPIDFNDVKSKISRTLNLDSSYKYFEQRGGALVLNFPANFGPSIANDMSSHLSEKVTEAVDSGLNRLVLDLSQVKTVDITLIELGLSVMKYAQDLSMRTGVIGEANFCEACRNYEETREWLFANSLEEVIQAMNKVQENAGG